MAYEKDPECLQCEKPPPKSRFDVSVDSVPTSNTERSPLVKLGRMARVEYWNISWWVAQVRCLLFPFP